MTDAHRFLSLYPVFEKTLELWSYKRHWAPNEHQLQTSLSNKLCAFFAGAANFLHSSWYGAMC